MRLRSLQQLRRPAGQTALVRVDFNVPLQQGRVVSAQRIKEALPTIRYLLNKKVEVVLVSHLGRPQGWQKQFSLKPVALALAQLLSRSVTFLPCDLLRQRVEIKAPLTLLENIRFYPGEQKNDRRLAKKLAALADFFVLDAFATAHRAHASTLGVAKFLPAYAGLLLEKEVGNLFEILNHPRRPALAILGGVKIADKIAVIKNLLKKFDDVLLGGALANNFLKAKGLDIKNSVYEPDKINLAKKLLKNKKIIMLF